MILIRLIYYLDNGVVFFPDPVEKANGVGEAESSQKIKAKGKDDRLDLRVWLCGKGREDLWTWHLLM